MFFYDKDWHTPCLLVNPHDGIRPGRDGVILDSMEQSPPEDVGFSASHEISLLLWNSNVLCMFTLVPIRSHRNPVHTLFNYDPLRNYPPNCIRVL